MKELQTWIEEEEHVRVPRIVVFDLSDPLRESVKSFLGFLSHTLARTIFLCNSLNAALSAIQSINPTLSTYPSFTDAWFLFVLLLGFWVLGSLFANHSAKKKLYNTK